MDLALGAAVAGGVSLMACRAMMAAGLVDAPNIARKAHKAPTPTSGGVGAAAGFALGMIVLSLLTAWRANIDFDAARRIAGATAFACAFAAIGLWDDARPLGPRLKFSLFAVASIVSVWVAGPAMAFPVTDTAIYMLPLWAALLGSALWVFTMVNAVNFMDGANGLAMGGVAVGLAGLALIGLDAHAPGAAALAACGAAALVGFLVWNYPSGKLFAGDSGALFAGALAALASLIAIREGGVSPFIPPLVFFPLIADVLLTLAWRARKRRSLLSGHAEHVYQIMIRGGAKATNVSLMYWGATGVCALAAFAAHVVGSFAPALMLALAAVAAIVLSVLARRFAKKRGLGEV
ncbi:undecaprenyl-phosphate N-acetylglucosaminyl 1-phosphate transferase [alpha proteobacterium U9-1i]|nr:undecaprenyl-phosphate N-acetylglucosaminyl 1-phosphate transferase [alpha proteobacterium U9-1i]